MYFLEIIVKELENKMTKTLELLNIWSIRNSVYNKSEFSSILTPDTVMLSLLEKTLSPQELTRDRNDKKWIV